jgi:UDP-2-acetamido-2-deoxy-ribo-hexuluronate aminotransferase
MPYLFKFAVQKKNKMRKIEMVDLKTQYQKIKPEIDEAIQKVIDSTAFIKGPDVNLFQKDLEAYLDVKHVITCANGTDALQVAMMALDLKPGDEVITSNFTFIATVEVIGILGLTPVLVDVDPYTFNIEPAAIEKAITSRTKAIVPIHLFGQCCNMDGIMEVAKKHHLHVIEDAAQALGSDYQFKNGTVKKAGTMGDIGCTSFFPSKNLGCYGDGGALYTNNDALADDFRSIVNHGMKVRYYHDRLGVNSRLDTLQAAILKVKLRHLDQYNKARQDAAAFYDHAFANHPKLQIPGRNPSSSHIFHQYTLVTKNTNRDELKDFLQTKNIPAMVYYPVPLHLQKAFGQLGYKPGDFPVSEQLCKQVISLPMNTELDHEQLQYITENILEFLNKN